MVGTSSWKQQFKEVGCNFGSRIFFFIAGLFELFLFVGNKNRGFGRRYVITNCTSTSPFYKKNLDGEISCKEKFLHWLSLPWKLVFALIPPTDYSNGTVNLLNFPILIQRFGMNSRLDYIFRCHFCYWRFNCADWRCCFYVWMHDRS